MTAARWAAAGVAVVLAGLVGLLATREPAQSTVAPTPLLGKPAPLVEGPDLGGDQVRLSSFRGKWVVLNFFASWCVPCQREHDDLVAFAENSGSEAQVLAVLFDDTPERARRFFKVNGGDWPVVVDPTGRVALEYGVRGPPESFVISPEGIVVARIVGEVELAGLENLLAEATEARAEAVGGGEGAG